MSRFRYQLTQPVRLGPGSGELVLSKAQLDRLRDRGCVGEGSKRGTHVLRDHVDFKAGEFLTLAARAPKVIWPKLDSPSPGEEPYTFDDHGRREARRDDAPPDAIAELRAHVDGLKQHDALVLITTIDGPEALQALADSEDGDSREAVRDAAAARLAVVAVLAELAEQKADEAIERVQALESTAALEAIADETKGDRRKTVREAATARLSELSAA